MKLLNIINKVIEYSFYLIFFLVPLALTSDTSELFEFNKLWVTFILTLVIGFAWFTKMVIKKEFRIQKTPLDIPIGLFLVSQIISSVLSLDPHTSIWGYYSRFNGGLLSILAYVFLYYAFVSNYKKEKDEKENDFSIKKVYFYVGAIAVFIIGILISSKIQNGDSAGTPFQMLSILITAVTSFALFIKAAPKDMLKRSIYTIFSSAFIVILWGIPSHLGYDPTCLLFRGTFDVSCWTNDFQPKVRIFSTLGQPDWMASYLAALIPIFAAFFINFSKGKQFLDKKISFLKNHNLFTMLTYTVLFILFYIGLLYTQSRSAIFAFWIILPLFALSYFWFFVKPGFNAKKLTIDFKALIFLLFLTAGVTFFAGQPFGQLNNLTFSGISQHFIKTPAPAVKKTTPALSPTPTPPPPLVGELGGTDSGKIRLLVWEGAINIWKNNFLFGSGLETYAFSYYMYRPAAHNLTSEWKFIYNKAHNEFLNYLATTGTFGILTYLSMIATFVFLSAKYIFKQRKRLTKDDIIIFGVLSGYATILITNFFGFSVVIINIFFYIFPAFVFVYAGLINPEKSYGFSFTKHEAYVLNKKQKVSIGALALVTIFSVYSLVGFWNADRYYYFGSNYDRAGDYQKAYTFLKKAIDQRPSEPTFRDEYAYNNAVLGSAILAQSQSQKDNQQQNLQIAKQLIDTSINTTNQLTAEHPNNIVFWKTKVRIFYTLGQVDSSYLPMALGAIKQSARLAPTDADVSYNLGVLYGQTGDFRNAVKTLENTIKLKYDYSNAYYALAIFYRQLAVDEKGNIVNKDYANKAVDELKLMEKLFGKNQQAEDALKAWSAGTN